MAPRILITSMSGTGKSTVIMALIESGLEAHDLDTVGFSHWVPCDGNPTGARPGFDWLWNESLRNSSPGSAKFLFSWLAARPTWDTS